MLARLRPPAYWVAAVAVGVCLALPGCGGDTSKVRGKVTFQGKPVVWGSVTLVDKTGAFHQGDIDLSGNYEIDKVAAGPVKIAVASPDPKRGLSPVAAGKPSTPAGKPKDAPDDARKEFLEKQGNKKAEDTRPRPPTGAWFSLDLKYADPTTSGLTGEVKSGTAELNIDIR